MSDDEHVMIEPPRDSSRDKPPGELNNYEAFEAFGLFRDYLDRTLTDLKIDIKIQTAKSQKKVPTFRLESNRIQFEFNSEILEGLECISVGIRQQDADLCNKLISKLRKRNKLIKIADRSPGGWATVREYEEPSLYGSDSEDDRKLEEAETRALKKIKLSKSSSTVQSDKIILFSCLLMDLILAQSFSFRLRHHDTSS